MQPLLASPPSKTSELQPILRIDPGTQPAAGIVRTRARSTRDPLQPSTEFLVHLSSSTESVTVTATTAVIGLNNPYTAHLDEERESLEKSFARLAAFSLEPEQPTDKDIIRRQVYRFPNR